MKQAPVIFQLQACECGTASLAMILAYHGISVSLERLREVCNVSARDGVNAASLIRAARCMGLEADGAHMGLLAVQKALFPVIIHWNFNHFVVLEGYGRGRFHLKDSTMGGFTVTEEEFSRGFTGVVITFRKPPRSLPDEGVSGSSDVGPPAAGSGWRRLSGMTAKWFPARAVLSGPAVLLAGLSTIIGVLCDLALPLFIWHAVDALAAGRPGTAALAFFIFAAALVKASATFARIRIVSRLELGAMSRMSARLFRHMLRLPLRFFSYRIHLEYLVFRSEAVARTLISVSLQVVSRILCILGYAGILYWISPLAAGVCFPLSLLVLTGALLALHRTKDARKKSERSTGSFLNAGQPMVHEMEGVKSEGMEESRFHDMAGSHAKAVNDAQKAYLDHLRVDHHIQGGLYVVQLFVLAWGGMGLFGGALSPGAFAAFLFITFGLMHSMTDLMSFPDRVRSLLEDLTSLVDVLSHESDPAFSGRGRRGGRNQPGPKRTLVETSGLTFGYNPTQAPLISDVSVTLGKGQWTALEGESGSGKTTLLHLLAGLIQPWSGAIALNGVPLPEMGPRERSEVLALVGEKPALFADTVWNNITLWRRDISVETVVSAARDACIHDDILQLAGGYQAVLWEDGKNISAGQGQRLALARALVQNSSILLLDDAMSLVDAEMEAAIVSRLRQRGITCLMVAHRLSTLKLCDTALVLHQGRIGEQGKHQAGGDGPGRPLQGEIRGGGR